MTTSATNFAPFRDRVREFRRVRASALRPNPRNWRKHPDVQQAALRAVLDEIGFAGALIARECDDGTLELIDGHLRAETLADAEVPVLVVDLSADEAALLREIMSTVDTQQAALSIHCAQGSVCVFDDEQDPDHLAGFCATVGDCSSSVVAETCREIRLRVRAMFYITHDLKAAVSVQVLLFGRSAVGVATALNLWGFYEFDDDKLNCGAIDVDVPLQLVAGYTQPLKPPCGAPTSVRITGLP